MNQKIIQLINSEDNLINELMRHIDAFRERMIETCAAVVRNLLTSPYDSWLDCSAYNEDRPELDPVWILSDTGDDIYDFRLDRFSIDPTTWRVLIEGEARNVLYRKGFDIKDLPLEGLVQLYGYLCGLYKQLCDKKSGLFLDGNKVKRAEP